MIESSEKSVSSGMQFTIHVETKDGGFEFACGSQERILHAGLRNAIDLPYECASGTCGTCKATLMEGDTEYAWAEAPGRKFVKADKGEVLMCQSFARSDCTLRVAKRVETTASGRFSPKHIGATLENLRQLAPDVVAFELALDEPLSFEAGQFVLLDVPQIAGARSYSMVNFARDAKALHFVVKRFPGGRFSEWLFESLPALSRVEIFGPLGHATFSPALAKHLVFIAGGSGIAGMMSMLTHAAEDRYFDRYDGRVFFGVRTGTDAFYLEELRAFVQRYPARLLVTIALSHEQASPDLLAAYPELAFDTGFVHEAAKRGLAGIATPETVAYVAGPPPMVDATLRMLLLECRFSGSNIRYDKFS